MDNNANAINFVKNSNFQTKVITGKVRLDHVNIWEPKSYHGSTPRYSVSLIIPKDDKETITNINNAIDAAIKENEKILVDQFGKINNATLSLPLRDGDIERADHETYTNSYFLNANSARQPDIVDEMVRPILHQSEVSSRCCARVSITFYAFNNNGSKGVAVGLNNIQKLTYERYILCETPTSAENKFGNNETFSKGKRGC